jgi:hypothetical protein
MIDRRAYWISGALVVVMLAATIWRIVLLPEWPQPADLGANRIPTHNWGFLLFFFVPFCVMLVAGILALSGRFAKGSNETKQSWRRLGSLLLVVYSLICTAFQFFILVRSLGLARSLDPVSVSRAVIVSVGILLAVVGNQYPKLFPLESRIEFLRLDAIQSAKHLRFSGWLVVLMGISFAICGFLLPVQLITPVILTLSLGFFAAVISSFVLRKREQLRQARTGSV